MVFSAQRSDFGAIADARLGGMNLRGEAFRSPCLNFI